MSGRTASCFSKLFLSYYSGPPALQRFCSKLVSRAQEGQPKIPYSYKGMQWRSGTFDSQIWYVSLCPFSFEQILSKLQSRAHSDNSGVSLPLIRFCLPDFGKEESVSIDGLDKASIAKKLEELVKKGESMPR